MSPRLLFFDLLAAVIALNGNLILKDLGEKEYEIIRGNNEYYYKQFSLAFIIFYFS